MDTTIEEAEQGHWIPRDTESVKCTCGGYAGSVDPTKEEIEKHGCDRDKMWHPSYSCCARAFVCCICKKRVACRAEAPDME